MNTNTTEYILAPYWHEAGRLAHILTEGYIVPALPYLLFFTISALAGYGFGRFVNRKRPV